MTYGVGVLVREGLVMMADTRTNAGLDNIATFRKLHLFDKPGEKMMALATAGNLGITQAVVSLLREGFRNPDTEQEERLLDQPTLFRAAQFVGHAIRQVHASDAAAMERSGATFEVTMLLGGQFEDSPPRLFMLYKAGNFIEATADTPYLQIGEHKYGKPILDRAVSNATDLNDCLKLSLISMDSTMRSNLSVGLPIDMVMLRSGSLNWEVNRRIDETEPYFHDLRERWSSALRKAHTDIPPPPYRD
jgi:putative proteasome-type protease